MPTELYSTTGLLEAPLVQPDGGVLFSNVTGGGVFRYFDGAVTTVVDYRRGIGGLALHQDGGLVMTGRDLSYADIATGSPSGSGSRNSNPSARADPGTNPGTGSSSGTGSNLSPSVGSNRNSDSSTNLDSDPSSGTGINNDSGLIHAISAVDGATGFNDLGVAQDGSLFVGVLRHRPQRGESAGLSEVLRISPAGEVTTAASNIRWPNGIGFSPDEQILYVCEYAERRILAIQDGSTRVFAAAPVGECDGLAVDAEGGIWVALGSGGAVVRFAADGTLHRTIDLPDGFASSVALHGTTLYITTSRRLLSETVDIPGIPVPTTRIPHEGS